MWEGGAAAFKRVDQWSDIDLQVDVADDRVADTFAVIEKTLTKLSPIGLKYALPSPTWHGHARPKISFIKLLTRLSLEN
jgi:hypothetical protein